MKITDRLRRNKKHEKSFNALFILIAAIIILILLLIIVLLAYIFDVTALLKISLSQDLGWFAILIWAVASIVIGLLVSYGFGQLIMKPINKIIRGMTLLSDGVYDEKIDLGKRNALKELTECYNKLAQELQKNEALSADFINNFSHELKTPLVSISGLISLMKQPNFPESKRIEYLDIIGEEANRLASLTTNILSLSKIESQKIVTDKEEYNLSEQIRNCVLLLQKKWERKNLDLILDFDEFIVVGNVDLLMQVWFNLIDNAIKFSYNNTAITILINEDSKFLNVSIENEGIAISDEDKTKIFQKFYQVDKGHNIEGNGIGLSIVRKIVELHDGVIEVETKNNKTKFIVKLAK